MDCRKKELHSIKNKVKERLPNSWKKDWYRQTWWLYRISTKSSTIE